MATSLSLVPGQSLGPFALGASIHEVLAAIKRNRQAYPAIDLHYSNTLPVSTPVVVSLPENGLRLRFDGADQRLRLIEVMDFKRLRLVHRGSELNKSTKDNDATPSFKRVYQAMGASFPGVYHPPGPGSAMGTYILSWPGVAFDFPLQHSAWSADKDHVSMLGSAAAGHAQHMAVFEGRDWPEASKDLFVKAPTHPRLTSVPKRTKDNHPLEIEAANIMPEGTVELIRAGPAPSVFIVLNKTTPQDLITELGPPDAMHRRHPVMEPEQPGITIPTGQRSNASGSQPSSYSSTGTNTFDTDFDSGDAEEDSFDRFRRERFWCYFSHGMDILVSQPSDRVGGVHDEGCTTRTELTVTKVVIHGNVPGSYAFNRHRRLRWIMDMTSSAIDHGAETSIGSEQNFEHDIQPVLLQRYAGIWPEEEMKRGKVVNRTWDASPSDSTFFLPDAGEDLIEGGGSEQWLGNTRLYIFPGLNFEVLDNGAVSTLTVC